MFSTLRLASLAVLGTAGLAGTAAAQVGPPGACACEVPPAPAAPVVVAEDPLPRWGVGLRASSMALAPESTPDAETQYGGGGFQVRYRVRPRWGVELAMDHFREQLENGEEGTRQLSSVTLSASYHFRPYARWDWYVLAGFGGTADGDPDISDEQREASKMGHAVLGVGVERRFRHLALGAELRAIGMSPPDDFGEEGEVAPMRGTSAPVATQEISMEELSGGQLSIAATYYF